MTLLQRLALPPTPHEGSSLLDSEDLRPFPRERRTWGFWTFFWFWPAAVSTVTNFASAGAFLSAGLSVWEGVACSTAGFFLVSLLLAINGRAGSVWHVGFPVYARSSFGVFGAFWPAINRAVMSTIWNGVNSVSGAQCIYVMLHAIFPSIARIENKMGAGSALTSASMICFFLFVALAGVMIMLDVSKWRNLIQVKLVVFVISSAAMLALVMTKAGGAGPAISRGAAVSGSEKKWLIIRFIMTSAASCSTFASNAADWQRNATKPNDPILGQILGFPISNFIVTLIGMLCASATESIYGEIIWNPVTALDMILTDSYDSKHRAGAFFIAAGFVYCLLFSCVAENMYPFANDSASLLPKYISIKRAMFICLALTCAVCPWYLLGSASIFISVLASYQSFLFSIVGVLLADYYLICKGWFTIDDMYVSTKAGKYHYTYGFNPRAFAGYFVGVGVSFAGFLDNLGLGIISNVALTRSYYFTIFTSTFASGATYYLLNLVWPQPNYRASWSEPKGVWEADDTKLSASSSTDEASLGEKEDEKDESNVSAKMVPEV